MIMENTQHRLILDSAIDKLIRFSQKELQESLSPTVNSNEIKFTQNSTTNLEKCIKYHDFISKYHGLYKLIEKCIVKSSLKDPSFYVHRLQTCLYLSMPKEFELWTIEFYKQSFHSFIYAKQLEMDEDDDSDDPSSNDDEDQKLNSDDSSTSEKDNYIELSIIHYTCRALKELGITRLMESTLVEILYHELESRIIKNASSIYDQYLLEPYFEWLDEFVVPWLQTSCLESQDEVDGYIAKFRYHVMIALYRLRTRELFEIIEQYPKSLCALEDLSQCIAHLDKQSEVQNDYLLSANKNLLVDNKSTKLIVQVYIDTIKSFHLLNCIDGLEGKVLKPFQDYLRKRSDSSALVISKIMNDKNLQVYQKNHDDDAEIDRFGKGKENDSTNDNQMNIVDALIRIYESKEGLVEEFQKILAERIFASKDYNIDSEITDMELLKSKLGEHSLHVCEVMIKDVVDSRRTDTFIHQDLKKKHQTHPLIISRLFWPKLPKENLELHASLKEHIPSYCEGFKIARASRHLQWLPYFGNVRLELSFENGVFEFNVSPLYATVVLYFQDKKSWTCPELASVCKVTPKRIESALDYWEKQGVIEKRQIEPNQNQQIDPMTTTWVALDNRKLNEDKHLPLGFLSIFVTENSIHAKIEAMRIYWPYIMSMLNNMGYGLSLDRIHTLLSMFVQGPNKFKRSKEELIIFMELMLKEEKVIKDGPLFKLNMKDK